MTTTTRLVEPKLAPRPERRHRRARAEAAPKAATTTNKTYNWSGFEIRDDNTYNLVSGLWPVPSVTGQAVVPLSVDYSTLWVGIDGDNLTDLVQAGTEQDAITLTFGVGNRSVSFTIAVYYAWTECLPGQLTEQQITNFGVSASDLVWITIILLNTPFPPTGNVATGIFVIENISTAESTTVVSIAFTNVSASEAEWIMERPKVNNALPNLANYGSALIQFPYAQTTKGQTLFYNQPNNINITMTNNSGQTLSTVTDAGPPLMVFKWNAFS